MPLVPGARLGPYEVVEPLGRGAMGEVYRARDLRLGRDVAVKVLPAHTATSADALARFEFEARAVAALNHPNILALHDVGADAGVSYAVTELLEGETLRDRLAREGPLPPRRLLDLAVQLARGLGAAHAQGLVHRDLKPENLFLTADGRLKILDFGIAVHAAASEAASVAETRLATEAGLIVGTIGYMAPEQVRGAPATARSDIFAFGLVLYEALTGANPFQRATAPETMAALLRDEPAPLSVAGMPSITARLIERCMEKRPEDRPESVRDLALVIEATAATPVEGGTAPDRPADIRRLARRAVFAASGIVAILTLITWIYVRSGSARTVGAAVEVDLARAEALARRGHQERLERLRFNARLVASIPNLRALFATDAPTIKDFLQGYQQRNPGTPVLIAVGPGGYVLARTGEPSSPGPESADDWMRRLRGAGDAAVILINGRPHHAALASAEAAGSIFGSVIAAAPVDGAFAQSLREVTDDEVVVLDHQGVAGTSLREGQLPWSTLEAFRRDTRARSGVTVGSVRYAAREVLLAEDPTVAAILLSSEADVPAPDLSAGVALIGLAAIALTLAAGLLALRRQGW